MLAERWRRQGKALQSREVVTAGSAASASATTGAVSKAETAIKAETSLAQAVGTAGSTVEAIGTVMVQFETVVAAGCTTAATASASQARAASTADLVMLILRSGGERAEGAGRNCADQFIAELYRCLGGGSCFC